MLTFDSNVRGVPERHLQGGYAAAVGERTRRRRPRPVVPNHGWQGGGLVLSDMQRLGPDHYLSQQPVPLGGTWTTLLRLHRGDEVMALPIFLPADAAIGAPG
jgi:hypothetical protein